MILTHTESNHDYYRRERVVIRKSSILFHFELYTPHDPIISSLQYRRFHENEVDLAAEIRHDPGGIPPAWRLK
jgi:hypothetical protein